MNRNVVILIVSMLLNATETHACFLNGNWVGLFIAEKFPARFSKIPVGKIKLSVFSKPGQPAFSYNLMTTFNALGK